MLCLPVFAQAGAAWTPIAANGSLPDRFYVNPISTWVGIGVNPPLYPFHVAGAGFVANPTTTDAFTITQTQTTGNLLKLSQGSATKLVVTNNGWMSLGPSAPQAKLDVLGGIRLTDGANGIMSLYGDAEGAVLIVGKNQGGTRDFRIEDATLGETMRVTTEGSLRLTGQGFAQWDKTTKTLALGDLSKGDDALAGGAVENIIIRTVDREAARFNSFGWLSLGNPNNPAVSNAVPVPQSELDIRDSYTDADNRADLRLSGSTGGGGVLRFYENTIERTTIRSDDPTNVGGLNIQTGGTTSNGPGSKFFIRANGDVKMDGALETVGDASLGNLAAGSTAVPPYAGAFIGYNGFSPHTNGDYAVAQFANKTTVINAPAGGAISFGLGGQAVFMSMDANGVKANGDMRVVGTLRVGTVLASNWQVTQAPDYVFEKDYELASLEKVGAFVEKNKHLPDVPSAKQMKSDGLDLVKMNFTLLKKVEELTLYAIKQEKRDRQRDAEMADLKRTIASLKGRR